MKSILLDVTQDSPLRLAALDTNISFRKYIGHIAARSNQESTITQKFFTTVLDQLTAHESFAEDIPLEKIERYGELLNLVYCMLVPPASDERDVLLALSTPIRPVIFYGTDAFYELVFKNQADALEDDLFNNQSLTLTQEIQLVYGFILEKLYGFPPFHYQAPVVSLRDDRSGMRKFYRLGVDNSFATVQAKGDLPVLDMDFIRREWKEDFDPAAIIALLPLSMFRFEGFSIITLTDVTAEHAVEHLKNTIINRVEYDTPTYHAHITESLKMLVEDAGVQFGLVPLLKVNNKLIFNTDNILHSDLFNLTYVIGSSEGMYISLAHSYFKDPKLVFMSDLAATDDTAEYAEILHNNGVCSCAILPVRFDTGIVGMLVVHSNRPNAVDEKVLARLEPALPLAAQVLQSDIETFNSGIDHVIREKFTSLQPAVQWKFRDAAWNYLRDKAIDPQNAEIKPIGFRNVYPLYGAIDIRNSTLERSDALRIDLQFQFEAIIDTLAVLKEERGIVLADEIAFQCRKWLSRLLDDSYPVEETPIREFLSKEVHPFLQHFREREWAESTTMEIVGAAQTMLVGAEQDEENQGVSQAVEEYFATADECTGGAYRHRRALERSMQKINAVVNAYLDDFRDQMQLTYPIFFEKFRTDGIEYDIYVGQSIEPDKAFDTLYLRNIRLWQLTSMAAIVRLTHGLIQDMEKPLLTTQLIFIHPGSIDVTFREDERRFDVEGAYNIRYQMLKKRIDKVHLRNSDERLTQPGKIALVYFNEQSAEEYVNYIRFQQERGTLHDDLEFLELEKLQGVYGLKALRVGVNLN